MFKKFVVTHNLKKINLDRDPYLTAVINHPRDPIRIARSAVKLSRYGALSNRSFEMLLNGFDDIGMEWQISFFGLPKLMKALNGFACGIDDNSLR